MALYLVSYLDRGNIGNAKVAGVQDDLALSDHQWQWVLYAFYIVYTCFEWSIIFWKILPAHIWCAFVCLGWSAAAMWSGAVTSYGGLVACRTLLGLFEAAFGAGAVYFLTLFYNRRELGVRLSLVLGTSPLANTFASALAYGIMEVKNSIAPWRLLFIIDSPSTAGFLTETEKTEAVERLQMRDRTAKSKVSGKQYFSGLADYKSWCHATMHFCCNYSFAGLSNFLPTVVANMGFTDQEAQGVTAPVYLASFLVSVGAAYTSDRVGTRGFFVAGFAAMGAVGYVLLATTYGTASRYVGVWLASMGIFSALALNVTWLFSNSAGDSKKGAAWAVFTTVGQLSSFISSSLYPDTEAPRYVTGSAVGCGLTGFIVIVSLSLHFKLAHENRKRDREDGPVARNATVDVTVDGQNMRNFRFMT
ncbi:uncharacterized protein LTR77_000936 [Saxophila tyrrhenica]|uniref:Uncharacterized protein n=1 Tax=Saxophila tyrrhenica TaxID=1690608 RepID=A0AAV9PP57_9PEZI|nr:hypothetical protein LTR77_000936 [Saxophila tyrrhenica]